MSRALQRRENIAGYLFMLPSLIFFIGFVVIPMVICIGYGKRNRKDPHQP